MELIQGALFLILLELIFIFITIIFPVLIVPFLVNIFSKNDEAFFSFVPFTFCSIALVLIGNIIWQIFVFNHIYYEWDHLFPPFTFLTHEEPFLDSSANWIASGWSLLSLRILWLTMIIIIYIISGVFTLSLFKKNKEIENVVIKSIIILSVISSLSLLLYLIEGNSLIFF